MRQEVSRDLEASKPLATQPQLTTDVNWPVTISQNSSGITFSPLSLTVNAGDTVTFSASDVSGTLSVPGGFFSTSGSFSLAQGGSLPFTVASPPTQKFVVVGFGSQNANGTITIGTGQGPKDPGDPV